MKWQKTENTATLKTKSGHVLVELERPFLHESDKWMVRYQSLDILDSDTWYKLDVAILLVNREFQQTAVVQSVNSTLAGLFDDYKQKRLGAGMDGKKLAELKGMRQVLCDAIHSLGREGVTAETREAFLDAMTKGER